RNDDIAGIFADRFLIADLLPRVLDERLVAINPHGSGLLQLPTGPGPGLWVSVKSRLEGIASDPAIRCEEFLAFQAVGPVRRDDRLDGIRHIFSREARAQDRADLRIILRAAAKRDLVVLGALLVDAENSDVAGVVMAAGVDAARD